MNTLQLTIRSSQGDRRVACEVTSDYRVDEVLAGLRQEWRLPAEHDFVLRHLRTGRQLSPRETLSEAGLSSGDQLELYPILIAGGPD